MYIRDAGMTYVTESGKFFIKSPPEQLHRKRPRRFLKLAESLRRWARDLARLSSVTKTKYGQYRDRLLVRDLREAIRCASPSEKAIMRHLLMNVRRRP